MQYIKLRHELVHARYDEEQGKWHLKIRRPVISDDPKGDKFEIIEDVADFVLQGTGTLSRWSWPDIEGLWDFKGKLTHSADWEESSDSWKETIKDWSNKRVGVIGVVRAPCLFSFFPRDSALSGIIRPADRSCSATACQASLQLCSREDLALATVRFHEDGKPHENRSLCRELYVLADARVFTSHTAF